jgi:hypothetical protein
LSHQPLKLLKIDKTTFSLYFFLSWPLEIIPIWKIPFYYLLLILLQT